MNTLHEGIVMAAAIVGGLSVIIGGVWAVYRVVRRVEDAIGKDRNGRTLAERMDRVEHQLWPNGGSSLADKVGDVERETIAIRGEHEVVRDMLTTIIEQTTKPKRARRSDAA